MGPNSHLSKETRLAQDQPFQAGFTYGITPVEPIKQVTIIKVCIILSLKLLTENL